MSYCIIKQSANYENKIGRLPLKQGFHYNFQVFKKAENINPLKKHVVLTSVLSCVQLIDQDNTGLWCRKYSLPSFHLAIAILHKMYRHICDWILENQLKCHTWPFHFIGPANSHTLHYPCTVALPGLADWFTFLEQVC